MTKPKIENFVAYEDVLARAKQIFEIGTFSLPAAGGFDVFPMVLASSKILGRKIEIERDQKLHPDVAGFCRRYPHYDLIVVNGSLNRPTQRFAAVKELGHLHFSPRVDSNMEIAPSALLSQILTFGIDKSTPAFPDEKVALIFAMEMTMPSFQESIRKQISAHRNDPSRLAHTFGVPKTFVVWRLHPSYPQMQRRRRFSSNPSR